MFRSVLFLMLIGVVSEARAQWPVYGPNAAPRSATVEESILRGAGANLVDQGRYLESLGTYQNLYQEALKKAYSNWAEGVHTRNTLKDEWHARNHGEDAVTKAHKRLDNIERMTALKRREDEMRERGLLPKVEPQIVWAGQAFRTWSDFKSSPAYVAMIAERDERFRQEELAAQEKKAAYDEAVFRMRYEGKLTPVERAEMLREPTLREIMGEKWWNDWQKYHPHE
jgi:hypothetical protein